MTKFNMVDHHRERHSNNDKREDPEIEIKMKGFEESKGTKANNTSEHLLKKSLQRV